jgi:hypothetical protein
MVSLAEWFPYQRDERAAEGFFTPLQENFYRAYQDSGIVFRSQRVCSLEAIVQVIGEEIRPHLTYLEGLADLLGRSGKYIMSWVRGSMPHYGSTLPTATYTLLSEAEITGSRVQRLVIF